MKLPNVNRVHRPASYWIITMVAWSFIALFVGVAIWSLTRGDIGGFIGFLLIVTLMLLEMFPPKWYQRFASLFDDD